MDKLPEDWNTAKIRKALLGAILAVIVLMMVAPFVAEKTTLEQETFTLPANATVVDTNNTSLGVAAGSQQALDFGRLIVNASNSTRYINVSTPETNLVTLRASGNISEHLDFPSYSRNASSIPVEMQADKKGYFAGNVTVNVQIPKKEMGSKWLEIKHSLYS